MPFSIIVKDVSKRYRIGTGLTSLRELFVNGRDRRNVDYHWAVKNVNFELQPGDALGIIGPNGAGKTTILKLLSQVTKPTQGEISVKGRFSALIELGAGFHPDLTGRENIYLNGAILGMRRDEIKKRFDQIVAFAGIGDYLETPVKRYSSGMYARLGFAIAAHVDPQILLVDEVLAVGDYAFQQKCYARMDELRKKGTSLIFVSHNMEAVRRVCDRGLVMYRGQCIFQGSAAESVMAYSNAVRQAAREASTEVPEENGLSQRVMTFDAEIMHVELLDETGRSVSNVNSGQIIKVAVEVQFYKSVHQPIFSCTVRSVDGRLIYDTTTRWMNIHTPDFFPGDRYCAEFDLKMSLLEGEYQLGVDVASSDLTHYYDRLENATNFWVTSSEEAKGLADLQAEFSIRNLNVTESV
jgi:ABC-type polysaccharide/polyol phosphate transport system ATPase subunit